MCYMLKYDSTHGKFQGSVKNDNGNLLVYGNSIRDTSEKDFSGKQKTGK